MSVKIKKSAALTSLSITPLIDVIFLLLIFFLVATRFEQEDREMDVDLPMASEARPLTEQPRQLFINIDKDGGYFVGGRRMSQRQVEQLLRQAKADNPVGQTVVIRADKKVQFDYAVQVINLCNRVGLRHTITTEGQAG